MSKKILVVDDERSFVRALQLCLERFGFEVTTAYNGEEALIAVETERPNLVLMDVVMPQMDGLEALAEMKDDAATKHIPVVLMTAKAQSSDLIRSWAPSADGFVTKDNTPNEIIEVIEATLKAHGDGHR